MNKRLTAKDFSPELLQLYDFYAHGRITKREFLEKAGSYALGLSLIHISEPTRPY